MAACPFGAIGVDTQEDKIIKCDLCEGQPVCVEFCEAGALQYVSQDVANLYKKRTAGERLFDLMRKYS
jgi:Fe-S-cluster-containing hydrogenase component 2